MKISWLFSFFLIVTSLNANGQKPGAIELATDSCKCLKFDFLNRAFKLQNIQNSQSDIEIRMYYSITGDVGLITLTYQKGKFSSYSYGYTPSVVWNPKDGPPKPKVDSFENQLVKPDSLFLALSTANVFSLPDMATQTTKGYEINISIQVKSNGKVHQYGFETPKVLRDVRRMTIPATQVAKDYQTVSRILWKLKDNRKPITSK